MADYSRSVAINKIELWADGGLGAVDYGGCDYGGFYGECDYGGYVSVRVWPMG